ncbi:MAG: NAD(P)-dependent oxidoreductase [Pseudomonadota bacterium]
MSFERIGFIGLGLMGSAMVECMQGAGLALGVVANRSRTAVDAAVARGAVEYGSARALAEACDLIMLCVDTSESVEARMRGDEGVIAGLQKDAVVVDFGTSLPGSTRALGDEVAAAGGHMLDAPLGRTPSHAREGKLNIMASGDEAVFDRVKPVFDVVGENVFHLGALGTGHTIKLLNNLFGMTVASATAEAFALCDGLGIDRKQFYDVVAAGPNHSGMMGFVAEYALKGNPEALAFSLVNARKDVRYATDMAADADLTSQTGSAARGLIESAVDAGAGDRMVSTLIDTLASD